MSRAREIGVTEDQLRDYNDNLKSEVIVAANTLLQDVKGPLSRIVTAAKNFHKPVDLEHDPEIRALATKYGFANVKELKDTMFMSALPRARLQSLSQKLNLSESDAQILLFTAFGVRVEDKL